MKSDAERAAKALSIFEEAGRNSAIVEAAQEEIDDQDESMRRAEAWISACTDCSLKCDDPECGWCHPIARAGRKAGVLEASK